MANVNEWSEQDVGWADREGVDLQELEQQIAIANGGQLGTELVDPCKLGFGIEAQPTPIDEPLSDDVASRLTHFVPASGAASRMFKSLVQAHRRGLATEEQLVGAIEDGAEELSSALDAYRGRAGLAVGQGLLAASLGDVLTRWLDEMALPALPKGLVPFHLYGALTRTAAEEQVLEAAAMAAGRRVAVHFTVPTGRERGFQQAVERVRTPLHARGQHVELSLSIQHPSTDTVALTPEGDVFRKADGTPLLRPGGHGALLRNLDALGADLVVVKNIDNVLRDDRRHDVLRWRRSLVRRLLDLESQVHSHLHSLAAGADGAAALEFAEATFGSRPSEGTPRERAEHALRRPLRVCGMVLNEGQPGGGPFWVRGRDGSLTPQIVESAQVDLTNPAQSTVFGNSTHFNPVDIAASLRDPQGRPYALTRFVDPTAWIVASKTHEGRPLRALERPGLWNGSMAGWNTVFVAIPPHVFSPVKQLADLLRPGHATKDA